MHVGPLFQASTLKHPGNSLVRVQRHSGRPRCADDGVALGACLEEGALGAVDVLYLGALGQLGCPGLYLTQAQQLNQCAGRGSV